MSEPSFSYILEVKVKSNSWYYTQIIH